MIKKEIKSHQFIEYPNSTLFISPGVYTREVDTALGFTIVNTDTLEFNTFPNNWSVNLGGQQRLILDGDGDMRITGRMHALGSVSWNQETNQLQFWDGNQWININNY